MRSGPIFYIFADWSSRSKISQFSPKSHASGSKSTWQSPIGQEHTWQPIKGWPLFRCHRTQIRSHITNRIFFLSLGSYRSKSQNSQKPQEHNEQFLQTLTQNQSQFRTVPQKASIQLLNSTQGIKMEANSYEFSSKFSEIHKNLHH